MAGADSLAVPLEEDKRDSEWSALSISPYWPLAVLRMSGADRCPPCRARSVRRVSSQNSRSSRRVSMIQSISRANAVVSRDT
jgi:hypothetical protein